MVSVYFTALYFCSLCAYSGSLYVSPLGANSCCLFNYFHSRSTVFLVCFIDCVCGAHS